MIRPPVRAVLFDLDCTLYAPECGLLAEVDRNITRFIERRLGLSYPEADGLRRAYHDEFGTTLRGLQIRYNTSAADYYGAVYDLDPADYVGPDPYLASLLDRIQATPVIFTNGTEPYAWRVLKALGLAGCFERVFDIAFAGYRGKPDESFYMAVVRALGLPPRECLAVDDQRRNAAAGCRLGMPGLWIDWSQAGAGPYDDVDMVLHSIHELPEAVPWLFAPCPPSVRLCPP